MHTNMWKHLAWLLMAALLCGCTATAEKHTGQAEGYGGTLRVSVSMNGSDVTDVTITEHHETQGVGTRAIDALPQAIVEADSVDVDNISGATITSEAIKEAVRQAMGDQGMTQNAAPMDQNATEAPALDADLLTGAGVSSTGRIGPGTAEDGSQVYSLNIVFAGGVFDRDGRIRHITVEQMEIVSPNLGGGNMLPAFPEGTEDEEAYLSAIAAFRGKRGLGEDYSLESGPWRDQMRAYEAAMVGMTVDEVLAWYQTHFDQETGRPLMEGEAYDALTDEQRQQLTDVTTSATMSLQGPYGDILLAIQRAWEDASSRLDAAPGGTLLDADTPTDVTDEEASVG